MTISGIQKRTVFMNIEPYSEIIQINGRDLVSACPYIGNLTHCRLSVFGIIEIAVFLPEKVPPVRYFLSDVRDCVNPNCRLIILFYLKSFFLP